MRSLRATMQLPNLLRFANPAVINSENLATGSRNKLVYKLVRNENGTLEMLASGENTWPVFEEARFDDVADIEDGWLRFSRVVTTSRAMTTVAVAVQATPRETTSESELVLMVCAAPRAGESFLAMSASLFSVLCAKATLKSKLDSAPGFISAAFLSVDTETRPEIWVVGVLGDVFEFLLHGATDTAELRAADHWRSRRAASCRQGRRSRCRGA
jgi:hypothetical protein